MEAENLYFSKTSPLPHPSPATTTDTVSVWWVSQQGRNMIWFIIFEKDYSRNILEYEFEGVKTNAEETLLSNRYIATLLGCETDVT